uniref:Proliferating cell nuclear antigen PCNA N-terminal domain-containing protein n=1 Tax=viral metagenome TaxID=1070528 RepID=A0A6C0J9X8_9ZZZZ
MNKYFDFKDKEEVDNEENFKIKFNNGSFFKNFVDFLSLLSTIDKESNKEGNKYCWLLVNKKGIAASANYNNNAKVKNINSMFKINLLSEQFTDYSVKRTIELNINPKNIQTLCKNINRSDEIILYSFGSKLSIKVYTHNLKKVETKEIIVEEVNFPLQEDNSFYREFCDTSYTIHASEMSNLKKGIGFKSEIVQIKLHQDKLLEFNSTSHGISPLFIAYGNVDEKNKTDILVMCSHIHLLSKLSNMCTKIRFYESKVLENEDKNIKFIKISASIDKPVYMGNIDIIISNIQ